ncbi:hypothetical protein EMCRGX_G027271 [Ephydatia muelleri]
MGVLVLLCAALIGQNVVAYASSGQPPNFIQEPQDTVVYNTSLVLKCAAQGDPSPTITWYRGDPPALVSDGHVVNGSLVIPSVVEGVDASRGGIPYHCRASSAQFGTIRSKTATVYYAFFGGFPEGRDITYSVKSTLGIPDFPFSDQSVALYCNVSLSNPPPSIIWMDNFNDIIDDNQYRFIYLDSGQYLVVTWIDSFIARRVFHCRVTNVFGMLSVDSPTRYRFNITASPGTGLFIYKPLQDVTAFEGDTNVQFSIVPSDFNASLVFVDCRITSAPPGSSLQSTPPFPSHCKGCLVISGPVSLVDSGTVVTCRVFSSANLISYTATLTVLARASLVVTSSPGDSLDNLVGTNVSFTCEASGVNLVVRWYRNGEEVSPGPRVVMRGSIMTIYGLLVSESGMYQCSVSNGTSSVWRQWRVVVSRVVPVPIMQTIVVVKKGDDLTLTVQVMLPSPPPDHVQWHMNGSLVKPSSLYLISNISVSDNSTDPALPLSSVSSTVIISLVVFLVVIIIIVAVVTVGLMCIRRLHLCAKQEQQEVVQHDKVVYSKNRERIRDSTNGAYEVLPEMEGNAE